jgi:prevent-host-death family protein
MKSVRIAELKARLSAYLRDVRRGHVITVLDRDTPVARLVPLAAPPERLVVRKPLSGAPRPGDLPKPSGPPLDVDILRLLLELRQGHR